MFFVGLSGLFFRTGPVHKFRAGWTGCSRKFYRYVFGRRLYRNVDPWHLPLTSITLILLIVERGRLDMGAHHALSMQFRKPPKLGSGLTVILGILFQLFKLP